MMFYVVYTMQNLRKSELKLLSLLVGKIM